MRNHSAISGAHIVWAAAFRAPPKGSSVQAFAPLFPGSRQERWWFVLADTNKNASLIVQPESLLTAEAAGVVAALNSSTENGHALDGSSDSEGGYLCQPTSRDSIPVQG